jgi:hypothetical protein
LGNSLTRIDSLDWFLSNRTMLWGLRNSFTGDTLIPPTFTSVEAYAQSLTLVTIKDTIASMFIDGKTMYGAQRMGLVNDTTGKFILTPRYISIEAQDLGPHGFSGCVRATLPGGLMALVRTDGSEAAMPCTWMENAKSGYARFCVGAKWTIDEPGEMVANVEQFVSIQGLNGFQSFGRAFVSRSFLEKYVNLSGGKWGYVDSTGRVVIPAQYDGARTPAAATGMVKLDKKWGLIDMTGAERIPCVYDGLSYLQTGSKTYVLAQSSNVRYGYIDRNGNIVIAADLKQSKMLGNGLIGFSRTGKWGVMNARGETVCSENYHEILPFSEGYAAVRRGSKWGYIDTLGAEVIAPTYAKAGPFSDGMARVLISSRWGYIDRSGAVAIEAKFLQAGSFSRGAAPVKTRDGFGLISKEGKWLQKPEWRSITPLDSMAPGLFVVRDDYHSGICRNDGKIIVPVRHEAYKYLGEGRISYRIGLRYGLADTTGKILTADIFDQLRPFSDKLAAASQNNLWGFIRPDGKFAIVPKYRFAGSFSDGRTYIIDGGTRFIDTTGKVVCTLESKSAVGSGFREGKCIIHLLNLRQEPEKMFFLTRHGLRLNKLEYKTATPFQDGAARVSPNGRNWGLVSFTGYYLVKPRFFQLDPFQNGLSRFQMRTTQGLFSIEGEPLLPVEYDWISYDDDAAMLRFERGNGLGYLFPDGRPCWPMTE